MARKTKAELAAEQAAFMADRRVVMVQEYPARLMSALEKATKKLNYELTVNNQLMFVLYDRDASAFFKPSLTPVYTDQSQYALEDLESELEFKAQEQDKAEARYRARSAALNKLTKEELELLNLN